MSTLVTFDVDGTLSVFGGYSAYHPISFQQAFSERYRPIPLPEKFLEKPFDGKTDYWIAREMTKKLNPDYTEEELHETIDLIIVRYNEISKESPTLVPYAHELLSKLSEMENVTIAIGSGNIPEVGWRKLELLGLLKYFPTRLCGMGRFDTRLECLLDAKKNAEEKLNKKFTRCIHIGDTLNDITSAEAAGFIPILTHTGRQIPQEELDKHNATVVKNFQEGFDTILKIVSGN